MIAFTKEINSISLTSSLAKIDLSQVKIKNLNYTNIMKNEIIKISKNAKTDKGKSFVKA